MPERSRQPRPQSEAQPVRGLVRPDPDQPAPPRADLRDALRARQELRRLLTEERGLDPEVVATLFGRRHRRDLAYLDRERLARQRREHERSLLSERDRGDVALVHLQMEAP